MHPIDNRFISHQVNEDQRERMNVIRRAGHELALLINENCIGSEERIQAVNAVDMAVMWANASIAREDD